MRDNDPKRIVFFDGVCNLCNHWVQFLLKRDSAELLVFASLQQERAKELLSPYSINASESQTIIFLEEGKLYQKSDAILRMSKYLSFPYPVLQVFLPVPRMIRDWIYDRVAKNRYRLFGRRESCLLPSPEYKRRFLD